MTLEEAIQHAQEVADSRDDLCEECRDEHRQLANWLSELKMLRQKKIYVVQKGIYSDRHILGVTTDKKRAQDIVKFFTPKEDDWGYTPEVEEFVDGALDGILYKKQKAYSVWLNNDGSFDKLYEKDNFDLEYFGGPSIEECKWRNMPKPKYLYHCIAANEEIAKKCAFDAYAQRKAEQNGL